MVRAKGAVIWGLWASFVSIMALTGCGGNSTAIGVTITAAGVAAGGTATVIENQTLQFSAAVTGGSASTVYWQICLPAITAITQPTTCTPIPGVTNNPTNTLTNLTGYGTITQTGLYTAPPSPPSSNDFVIMAASTVDSTQFGIIKVQIDSGVRVTLNNTAVTIPSSGTFNFVATVTGSTNQSVSWSEGSGTTTVNAPGGNSQIGTIQSNGEYIAPATATGITVTITATASADTAKTATAIVTVLAAGAPTLTSIDPTLGAQGSAQQDIFLTGQNFATTDTVLVTPPSGQTATTIVPTFISATLLRATIPSSLLTQAGNVGIQVQRQDNSLSSTQATLMLSPVRAAVVALSPDNTSQGLSSTAVSLTGGFFSPVNTTVTFGGTTVPPVISNSQQLMITAGAVSVPGLYPITVSNSGIPAGQAQAATVNVSVTPTQSSIGSTPSGNPVAVGTNPAGVAIDYGSELAVVVNNTASGSVSIMNLASNPPSLVATVAVGKNPTGVAVDDLLSPHAAFVVNSGDQTVSSINLTTDTVTSTVSVAIGPVSGSNANIAPVPYSIGVNPETHRAVVAYQSFNEVTVWDVSSGNLAALPSNQSGQLGGATSLTAIGTGTSPAIAIDPQVNWAIITPGSGGIETTNVIDLGHNPNAAIADPGRAPAIVASLGMASSGVGIDSETHQAFLTSVSDTNFTSFSLLDNSVNPITYTKNGVALSLLGYVAADVDPLIGIGVAVNANSATATIVNIEAGTVLQTVTLAGPAQAVAIDPYSNQAVVVNQSTGTGTISILSLGNAINPVQIVESSPSITYTTTTTPLTLKITGGGFTGGQVLLDGTALPAGSVTISPNGRQIVATVPATMLGSARNYAVQVQTTSGISNARDLTVIQPVNVGTSPVGVAIDNDRDLAVVTNSGSNTVSLVALSPSTPVGLNQVPAGAVGTIGQPISVGSSPLGVATIPRLGLALIANNASNNVSLVDVTQTYPAQTFAGCGSGGACTGQLGVAIDQDSAIGVVTNSTSNNNIANNTANNISYITITGPTTTATTNTPPTATASASPTSDLNPTAVAIDPVISSVNPSLGAYAGVTSASQSSTVELLTVPGGSLTERLSGFQTPTDIKFDPLNQVFLVANDLLNQIVILNPNGFTENSVAAGIDPSSLDYNFQTSTLATLNRITNTVSVLDYVCPPVLGTVNSCPAPQVQKVLGVGGSQEFSVAIDLKLNLAVVVDQVNNRILLVPLPH